jgi:hypothetical protein
MYRYATLLTVLTAILIAAPAPAQVSGQEKVVEVEGEGYSKEDSLKQALRAALEQGAGTQIASFTRVENFELARDTIYSRASGIVTDYTILDQREMAGGTWLCKVRATVRPDAVAAAWGEVVNVLDQVGNPTIMVLINEKIDERPQDSSIVESRIKEMFSEAGFRVMSRTGVEEKHRREAEAALLEGDNAKLIRLAKDAGANILIRGSARADWAGIREVYNMPVAFYNCTVMAEAYYTDSGELLASESIPTRERGVRSHRTRSPQAAMQALVDATFPDKDQRQPVLAQKLFDSVMEKWSVQISAGGTIELDVERMSYRSYVKLKKALAALERVQSVDGEFDEGHAKLRIKAQINAETLAELLIDEPFESMLEIDTQKMNVIKAHGVN